MANIPVQTLTYFYNISVKQQRFLLGSLGYPWHGLITSNHEKPT